MKITKLNIESTLFGKNVFHLDKIETGEKFCLQEKSFIEKHNPYYAECGIESSDLRLIHSLEEAGFRFMEFRVTQTLNAMNFNIVGASALYPFQLKQITDKQTYKMAEKLLLNSMPDDRFSRDSFMESDISQARLAGYLNKSFTNHENEFLYGLFNAASDELIAIKSGECIGKDEVLFYLSGVSPKYETPKYSNMLDTLIIGSFVQKGVHQFRSVTSGFNVSELNLRIRDLNFTIESTTIILRKIYNVGQE